MKSTAPKLEKKAMLKHYERFRQSMTSAGDGDRAVAEEAIERLYIKTAKEKPAFVWCQSIYQMLTMPSLIIGILHSDIWELLAGEVTEQLTGEDWSKYWDEIWPDIWQRSGLPLLNGMAQTSRISTFYAPLDEALIAQTKTEFGKALHSGRLNNMQRTLNREMYRRFWAPQNRANDFAKADWIQLKHVVFATTRYVRDRHSAWPRWTEIPALDNEMHFVGDTITSLFNFLATRLGGEPRGQSHAILDVPAGIPWLGTATLLTNTWTTEFECLADDVKMWLDISNNSSALLCLDGLAFLCEKPSSFTFNQQNRLHNGNGPALLYSDGFAEYAWEGVVVPKFVIEDPNSITVHDIETSENIELRRIMLERYGTDRYIKDADIGPVQEDECGTLYRRELPGDEALVMVKVTNSTAEPDGTFSKYFLRVPPHIETAREAVAWTFDVDPDDYHPAQQT